MVEDHRSELAGRELRGDDHTWQLTGNVDVRGTGELLEAEAKQADDVRHRRADLRFVLQDPPILRTLDVSTITSIAWSVTAMGIISSSRRNGEPIERKCVDWSTNN